MWTGYEILCLDRSDQDHPRTVDIAGRNMKEEANKALTSALMPSFPVIAIDNFQMNLAQWRTQMMTTVA